MCSSLEEAWYQLKHILHRLYMTYRPSYYMCTGPRVLYSHAHVHALTVYVPYVVYMWCVVTYVLPLTLQSMLVTSNLCFTTFPHCCMCDGGQLANNADGSLRDKEGNLPYECVPTSE